MSQIETIIGYDFKNKSLVKQALTHGSYSTNKDENYERLEFLGDRVLSVAIADMLYRKFPDEPEGSLSQRHTALVCKEAVSKVALSLSFDKYMIIMNEELRHNENVLCDICEAIIGALFLDGGALVAFGFIEKNWENLVEENVSPPKDSKTTLQEFAHVKNFSAPVYQVVKQEGTEHEPLFYMEVSIKEAGSEIGQGRNKKIASLEAAAKMLKRLGFNE